MLEEIAGAVSNTATVTREEGMGQRLLNSIVGVIIGIALFLLSFVVLWWNEGNVIDAKNALNEMQSALVEAKADAPSKAQAGKLVHVTGKLSSEDKLGDAPYLKPGKYLVVERHVETFQWVEHEHTDHTRNVGGSRTTRTTYTYAQEWAEDFVDSTKFNVPAGHTNTKAAISAPPKARVKHSHLGKFDGGAVLDHIDSMVALHVSKAMLVKPQDAELANDYLYQRQHKGPGDKLGDQRLHWRVVQAGPVSVIAKQQGASKLTTYVTKNGREEFLVATSAKKATAMIETAKDDASSLAMILRVVGFFMMWIGLNLCTGPIVTLLDVIPFLGTAGRFVLAVIFFVASLVLTLVTIVVSMIAHHPVVLVLTVLAAAGGGYYLWDRKKKGKGAAKHAANAEEVTEIGTKPPISKSHAA